MSKMKIVFLYDEKDGVMKLTILYNFTKEIPSEIRLSDLKSSDNEALVHLRGIEPRTY